jgi:hypothetical protein
MKKNSTHILSFLLGTSFLFNNALIAQNPTQAHEKMTVFRRVINRYKNIYERSKKCRENRCSQAEKEMLNREINKVAKEAALAAIGIITLIAGSAALYLLVRSKLKKPTPPQKEPITEPSLGQKEPKPGESPKKEELPLQEQQHLQELQVKEEQERQKATELKRQQEEQATLQRQQEEEQKRRQEELRRKQEEERLEQKRQQEELRRQAAEEQRKLAEEKMLTNLKQKIQSTLIILKTYIETYKFGDVKWLQQLQNTNLESLSFAEAKSLSEQITNQYYKPTEMFVELLKTIEKNQNKLPPQETLEAELKQLYNTATDLLNAAKENYRDGNIAAAQKNAQSALDQLNQLSKTLEKPQTWSEWGWSWLGY